MSCIREHLRRPSIPTLVASLRAIGIEADEQDVSDRVDHMLKFKEKNRSGWYSDSSWIGWLKFCLVDRLSIRGRLREPPDVTTATLHVGFISIVETDEQLSLLRKDPSIYTSSVARSKMATTTLADVAPVDRVAKRVSQSS